MDGSPHDQIMPPLHEGKQILGLVPEVQNVAAAWEHLENDRNDRTGKLIESDGEVAVADGPVGVGTVRVRPLELAALVFSLPLSLLLVMAEEGLKVLVGIEGTVVDHREGRVGAVGVVIIVSLVGSEGGGGSLSKGVAGRDGSGTLGG